MFRLSHLSRRERCCLEIDGAALRAHVKTYGGHVEQANEGRREYMLSGMLLYVIAPAGSVNAAVDGRAGNHRRGRDVKDAAVLFVHNFVNRHCAIVCKDKLARIVHLSAAGRIEGRAIEYDRMLSVALDRLDHTGIEVVEERVVIVEALGH